MQYGIRKNDASSLVCFCCLLVLRWCAVFAFLVYLWCAVLVLFFLGVLFLPSSSLIGVVFSPLLSLLVCCFRLCCPLLVCCFPAQKKQMGRFLLLSDPLPLVFLALDGSRQPKSKCLAGCAGQNKRYMYVYIYYINIFVFIFIFF